MVVIDSAEAWLNWALGLDAEHLSAWQMVLRAALVYPIGIAFVRAADKRFIGKFTAFDVILGIMIGSVLSRAITGNSPFLPTVAAALALVVLHSLFASLSFHSSWFGEVVKGRSRTLVRDGTIQWDAMRKSHMSELDLMGALRENGGTEDLGEVKVARLERSGNISVIKAPRSPARGRTT